MNKFATIGLIQARELKNLIDEGLDIKVIDASFVLPHMEDDPVKNFNSARIHNAIYFDIDAFSDQTTDLPHMIPSPDEFSQMASAAGLSNDNFIVIYDQFGIGMAACRAWWVFKVFGHQDVVILDGGLPAWTQEGFDLNTSPPSKPFPGQYKVTEHCKDRIAKLKDVQETLDHKAHKQIVDARPASRFNGESIEPRAGLKSGHIPGSINLPWQELVDPDSCKLKPKTDLYDLLADKGISTNQPVIASCGSGATACVIDFVFYYLGLGHTQVYDGSWAEYGRDNADTPVATKL